MTSQTPPQPNTQRVTAVTHWSDFLFSFRITRPKSFRFRSGEFVMIGLEDDNGKPILRAYSIASPSWDSELEFYSIKVPDGPLTSRLQNIAVGDGVILRPKAVGTLVLDALLPGKRLYLVATGTGVAPFASLVRDPDIYDRYEQIILTHTTQDVAGLAYSQHLIEQTFADPLIGEIAKAKLIYYPSTTREISLNMGRPTALIRSGELARALILPPINASSDRIMICGSIGLNQDMKTLTQSYGMTEGSNSKPGTFVLEKAFVG